MAEESRLERQARQVFVSILSHDMQPTASSSTSAAGAAQAFQSRVQGKRVTLANLDRPRPTAPQGSTACRQITRRDARLVKQAGRPNKAPRPALPSEMHGLVVVDRQEQGDARHRRRLVRSVRGREKVDDSITYDSLVPVHHLWLQYIHQLLGLVDPDGKPSKLSESLLASNLSNGQSMTAMQTSIVKADLIGASLSVVRSTNPSLVGIEGIVAKESEGTFSIVVPPSSGVHKRKQSSLRLVAKQNSDFLIRIALPKIEKSSADAQTRTDAVTSNGCQKAILTFTLYGNQLRNTLPTRATKKFKARKTVELG